MRLLLYCTVRLSPSQGGSILFAWSLRGNNNREAWLHHVSLGLTILRRLVSYIFRPKITRFMLMCIGHAIILIVFCAGGLGLIGWVKQRMASPTVSVACSLAAISIITILTREGMRCLSEAVV